MSDHDRPAAAAADADEQRDYQLFKENEKVRKATYSTYIKFMTLVRLMRGER